MQIFLFLAHFWASPFLTAHTLYLFLKRALQTSWNSKIATKTLCEPCADAFQHHEADFEAGYSAVVILTVVSG